MFPARRALTGMVLVLTGMAIYLAIDVYRSGLEEVVRQFASTQRLLAQEAAHEAVILLEERASRLTSLARLSSVQRLDGQRIQEDLGLDPQVGESWRREGILVVDAEGRVVFANPAPPVANFQGAPFLEWSRNQDSRQALLLSSWSQAVGLTNAAPKGLALVATPIYRSKWDNDARRHVLTWVGALAVTVPLERVLTEHLQALVPKGQRPRLWIMDQDGTVLVQSEHPEMENVNIHRTSADCAQCHKSFEHARRILSAGAGTTDYQLINRPKKLAAYAPMQFANASWVMVVNAPYNEVTAFVGQSYRKVLALLGTVALGLSLAALIFYQNSVSRFRINEESKHSAQKHELEQSLRRTEERYRTLFEQSPDGILILDPESLRPIEFNDAAHLQLGYSREEFARKCVAEHGAHGTSEERRERLAELLRSGRARIETEYRARTGELRSIEVIAQTLQLADRTYLHCIHRDITERKRAEDLLTGRSAQLEALHQVCQGITAETETGALLRAIAERAFALFGGSSAWLWLHRRGSDELECVASAADGPPPPRQFVKKGQLLAGQCWEQAAFFTVLNRPDSEVMTAGLEPSPWNSAIVAPLRWGDAFLGVLEIHAKKPGFFTRDDAALLGLFATQAAIAINNAGLLEWVRRDENIKSNLLHDVSHRVKNNLARLLQIIRLERERIASDAAASKCGAILMDLENRLHGMELVHTMLSTSQWRPLPLRELVTQIVTGALSGSPIRERIRVSVLSPREPLRVVPEQATAIALILSELATNSVKHAFENRAEGRMEIRLHVEGEIRGRPLVRLQFRDDGPGWPAEVLDGRSHHVGLHLIEASVRSPLRGELALRNDQGAIAEVTFKLALIE